MISFTILDENSREGIVKSIMDSMPDADGDYLSDIIDSLLEDEGEIAVSNSHGCFLIRIFDGEYSFVYPVELTEEADPGEACDEIRLYAMKEEIPLVFCDVPCDSLGELISGYRHMSIDASDPDCEAYTVRMHTEATLIDEIPTLDFGEITLDALTEEDDGDYARLSKDEETNKFWGYDYTADIIDSWLKTL